MADHSKSWARRIARWISVVVLITGSVLLTIYVEPEGVIFALPLAALAGFLLIPELTRPVTILIDVLFAGRAEGGKPPLDLRLARGYVKQERLEEALEEYLRMMKFHPHVSEAYEQAMILTARTGGDRAKLERLFKQGLRRVGSLEEKADLRAVYDRAKEEIGGYER